MGFGISDQKEPGSPWDSSISNALSAISRTGAVSPKPDYGAYDTGISNASGGGMEYGMSPEETTGLYDESFQKGMEAFAPFAGGGGINPFAKKLHKEARRDNRGVFADIAGDELERERGRGMNLLAGQQGADTSARRFEEESGPGQYSGTASAMVRAKALLPYLKDDQDSLIAGQRETKSAKMEAIDQSVNIANSLAKLHTDYTNSLASYNSERAGFASDFAGKRSGMAVESSRRGVDSELDWRKSQAQIAESARATNLRAALEARGMDQTAATAAEGHRLQGATSYLQNSQKPMWSGTVDNFGRPSAGYTDYERQMETRRRAEGMLI